MALQIRDFFETYARAFDRADVCRIASFYSTPCLFVDPDRVTLVEDGNALHLALSELVAFHRDQGVSRAAVASADCKCLGPTLALATIGWYVYGPSGTRHWAFTNTYNLVKADSRWGIVVSTTHG